MATITALQVNKRRRKRVDVALDGARAFSLAPTLAAPLRVGQRLDAAEIARLQAEDEVARAVDQAARYLGQRPRSVAEVRRNLRQKGYGDDAIVQALERMTAQDWLDDLAFARFWVEDRLRFRPMGRRALAHGLRQKGVAPELVEAALAEVDEPAAARRAAASQWRRWRGRPREELRPKLWGFLQRRGFPGDLCHEVVTEILTENGAGETVSPVNTI